MTRLVIPSLLGVVVTSLADAGADDPAPPVVFPTLPSRAASASDLVPKGWTAEKESRADLNDDGAQDLVLVLHMTDPNNLIASDDAGKRRLDTNPRILVVALADKTTNAYTLALANHTLIPRRTDPDMDDPLGDVALVKGTIQVSLGLFMSAGSWSTSRMKLTFRYQDGCFKLIGYDSTETQRNTGEISATSINYLTKKAKISTGNIEEEGMKDSWKTLQASELLCMDAVGDGLEFTPEP